MSDTRKERRYVARMMGGHAAQASYEAYNLGEAHGYLRTPKKNPYPPGRRHREYERGYARWFTPKNTQE